MFVYVVFSVWGTGGFPPHPGTPIIVIYQTDRLDSLRPCELVMSQLCSAMTADTSRVKLRWAVCFLMLICEYSLFVLRALEITEWEYTAVDECVGRVMFSCVLLWYWLKCSFVIIVRLGPKLPDQIVFQIHLIATITYWRSTENFYCNWHDFYSLTKWQFNYYKKSRSASLCLFLLSWI